MAHFHITWRDGAYYVSIPNYSGGDVVELADHEAQIAALEQEND